jgi:hypothetical protein
MNKTKINLIKHQPVTNVQPDTTPATEVGSAITQRRPASRPLKLLVLAGALAATGLSYRAGSEAIVVSPLVAQVQQAGGQVPLFITPVHSEPNLAETNPRVAGL